MGRSKFTEKTHKICSICREDKPIEQYDLKSQYVKRAECKQCRKISNKTRYDSTKDQSVVCECGQEIKWSNRYMHVKSKKHLKSIESTN